MEAPPLERKLVAILAADVEGYSRLMGADEEGTLATLSAHRAIIDALIARHGGRICGTAGDSVLAEFASVFAAVECAVEIQRDLAEANQPLAEHRRMWFRIGINVGDVMVKQGDIFGDGVNIAARLEALAEPGGICISRGVRDQIRRKLPYGFDDLGEQSVKNIARPIRVFRLLVDGRAPEVGAEEPEAADPAVAEAAAEPAPAVAEPEKSVELVFWESIKDSLRAADFEAYLKQYPDGAFVDLARTRLEEFASAAGTIRDPKDREVELAFWESVRGSENPDLLRAYLDKYPEGEFKPVAEIRLRELAATRS
ncbi:MAG: adenylate/guanylate cyclase domain-containing protein [Alphaproteobacteria bacterium]|nr:adenylate/guanylate cyclase domain-containing protein [Alphaproteobacteria bacterium]